MAFRRILKYPDSKLKNKSAAVLEDDDVSGVVTDLWDTLNVGGGVGLSAPQIGIFKRVIYVACPTWKGEMINPVITEFTDLSGAWEGCLSFPGVKEIVPRYETVEVEYQKLDGTTHTTSLSGLPAQVVQHEVDHLDGKLMIDHFSAMKKSMIAKKTKKVMNQVKAIMTPDEKEPARRVRKTAHLSRKEIKKRKKRRKMNR